MTEKTFDPPIVYSEEDMGAIEEHLKEHFGSFDNVFHEIVSPDIHVDIVIIPPTKERNYYILSTMGMGARAMNTPAELAEYKLERAEIFVCLPADWDIQNSEEEWYWPLRWLKILARLPIYNDTWLGWGHTIPNGEPFADNTNLSSVILLNPGAFDDEAAICTLPNGEIVNFYQMVPLYEEELQLKLSQNADALLDCMNDDMLESVDIHRNCAVPQVPLS